jgi:hypothetical protein
MGIANVLLDTTQVSTRDAAFAFAQAGIPIFPCAAGGKRPLTPAGFRDATSDLDQARDWWARWPTANIGMPTGGPSGIDVVDIDIAAASSGYVAYERASAAGLVGSELARVRTPSQGMHVYFPAQLDRPQRCWQAAAAHIDFRGDGGYVVVPPSVLATPTGRISYRLDSLSAAVSKPVDAALAPAAELAGLPAAEIAVTIRSASRQAAPGSSSTPSAPWCDPIAPVRGRGDAPCLR